MPRFELTDCRIKIQVRIGHFPDGRARTRTFGIKNVRPDVTADDIAAVVRAVAPLLAYPVVQARLVRKYALVAGRARLYPSPLVVPMTAPVRSSVTAEPRIAGNARASSSSALADFCRITHPPALTI